MAHKLNIFLRSKTANIILEYKSIRVQEYKECKIADKSARTPDVLLQGLRPTSWQEVLGVCRSRERGIGSARGGAQ